MGRRARIEEWIIVLVLGCIASCSGESETSGDDESVCVPECHNNATCINVDGSDVCVCDAEFTGNGTYCTAIFTSDPCTDETHNCSQNATCESNDESFNCTCNSGFSGDGVNCEAKRCPPTWIINGSAPGCEGDKNIGDTCAIECNTGFSRTGSTTATCEYDEDADTKGSWNIGDIKCLDINECDFEFDNTCSQSPKGICTNTAGSYKCSCAEEYAGNGRNCQKKVKLEPMRLVKVTQTTATLEIVSPRRHQSYEIKLLNADGDVVKQFVQSDSTVVFRNLTGDAEYQAQVRITVLQNGVSVSLDFTEPTTFRTERKTQKGQIQIPGEFIPEHADTESPATQIVMKTIVRIFINENGLRSYQFVKILRIFKGSIIVVIEVTTNGTTNETLTDAEITNPNITVTEVSVGVDPAPGNVAVTEITTSSFRISFDPVPMAILYQITVDYGNRTEKFTNETSLLVDGLPSNTLIVASVTAFIQEGGQIRISNSSEDILFKTASEGPANLVITVLSGNYIIVQFDAVYTAETYYVMFKNGPSFAFTLSADDEADGVLRERVQGLTADVSYTISVVANVGGQNSTESTATAETGPETVSGVSIYNVNGDGFNVEYDPVNIVPAINTSYIIKYTWDSGNREETTTETDLRISASPLVTNYMVSVAYETSMKSSYSAPVSTKIWDLGNLTNTSFDLSWDHYKTATTYSVSLNSGSPESVSGRSISLTDLSSGTEYIVDVSTDEKVLFTIKQLTCPPAIANLGCEPKTLECISVNFNSALSATSYDISVTEDSSATIAVNSTDPSAEICGLAPGTEYTVNAKAINSVCEGEARSVSNCVTAIMCTSAPSIRSGAATGCAGDKAISETCNLVCNNGFYMSGNGIAICEDDASGDSEGTWNNSNSECLAIMCTMAPPITNGAAIGCNGDKAVGDTCNLVCHTGFGMSGSATSICEDGGNGDSEGTWNIGDSLCKEANECSEGLASCDGNAECTNTIGSYRCTCSTGYKGSGTSCGDIDECKTGTASRCSSNTDCTNTPGNYTCECKVEYEGNPEKPGLCNEILRTPVVVDVTTDTLKVLIQPRGSYQEYEYTLYNDMGVVVEQPRTNETTYKFDVTPGTSYSVTARITILADGTNVNVTSSDALEVTTIGTEIAFSIVFPDLVFTDDLNDSNSEAYANMSATIKQRLEDRFPGKNITAKIFFLFPGSVGVLGSIESTNPTFTITDAIAGPTITEALSSTSPPDNLVITSITSNGFTASWIAVSGASQYILEVSCNGESQTYAIVEARALASGLQPNTACEITVRAVLNATALEVTAKSTSVSLTTPPSDPGTPVAVSRTTTSISVEWAASTGADSYNIKVLDDANIEVYSETTSITSHVITGLISGTCYTVHVKATNAHGDSSTVSESELCTLTEAATNFAVASNTQNEGIRLSWDPAAGAASYRVNFSRSDGVSATITFTSSPGLITTVLGLTYHFTIETINAHGDVGGVSTLNIQAEPVKVITFEITMNSSFIFTNDLRDKTSMTFMNLRDYTAKVLTIILTDVHGFVRITIVEFVGGSVVVRFNVDINEPATNADAIMAAYEASTEDKTAFSTDLSTNLNECLNVPNVCHAHADCTDNDASYTCACKIGYTGDGKATCTDVNECNSNPCHANAFCTNTLGTFSCTCKVGYQGTGVTCTDQDECETPGICGEIGTCKNTEGSYRCNCPAGYTDIGSDCVDDDECATNPCTGAHSTCKNNPGRYTCECDTGYKSMSTSDDCIDVDECTETPTDCSVNQTCANTDGSYRCSCKPGYQAGGNDCHDMDECSLLSPCLESATCTNSVGSYICVCNDGFTGDGEVSCEDVNECDDNSTCSGNETCANAIGSYTCSCAGGFSGTPNTQCLDIDECSDPDLCEPHGDCDNTVGSYFCVCDNGYVEDSGICVDKDECDANEIACSDRATCANTEGSYRCDCKKGYTGSNDICKDVDECTTELCPLNLTCINTEGSYTCNCGDGYTQTEDECRNINECDLGTENCPADRDCSDTDGNYKCNCKTGYTGTDCVGGQDCTECVNVNECDNGKKNCDVNAVCTDTDGSFSCACKTYYTGDGFECTGDMTALYVEQGMNEKGRSNHMVTNLTSEVKTQVELQFRDFTFINVVFTNTSGTVIKATYSMQTARPIPLPVQLADYYNSTVGDTNLFTTEPTLAGNCGDKLSCAGGYCYEYNTDKRCGCNVGYKSSDSRCEDDDECGRNPCDEFANCANTPGSFTCTCKTGYTGDGTTCTDLDECSTTSFNCTANSACSNSIGSYMCTCNFGYTKTTDNTCKSQCEDFICQNGGTCVPSTTGDTPTCQCTSEYQGPKCGESSLYRNLAIAFGVIGGLLLIALIVAIVVYCVKRKSGGMDFVP